MQIDKKGIQSIGQNMYGWAKDLFPICRSITGPGVRETLNYIKNLIPDLTIHEVPSGTQAFDWTVPDEWTIRDGYIADESGQRIIDFQKNNLHVIGYSKPVDRWLELEELDKHLYSVPEQPLAIPYVTSYYKSRWGFCISHNQRQNLKSGRYHVKIDSDLKPGMLNYAELLLPGETTDEVLLSTYVCHPSMGNNEISGICVTTAISEWLSKMPNRRYTYRILFLPETIGSIVYLSKHASIMKEKTIAGFVVTCVGDNKTYSFLPSRFGHTLADQVARHVLKHKIKKYERYSFLDRGSDERQYCCPLINLPVVSVMRSKYGTYPEYHTSLDDLSFISPEGMGGSLKVLKYCINFLESNYYYRKTIPCEPQLGERGLYPNLSTKNSHEKVAVMMNLIAYCDGTSSLLEIADIINAPLDELIPIVKRLVEEKILERCD